MAGDRKDDPQHLPSRRPATRSARNPNETRAFAAPHAPLSPDDDPAALFLDGPRIRATTATRLFRNRKLLDAAALATQEFIRSGRRGRFRLWSTGCSSGEEVYSMCMVALHEFARNGMEPRLEAYGADINAELIRDARAGRYLRPSANVFEPRFWRLLRQYSRVDSCTVQMLEPIREICRFVKFDLRNRPKKHTFHFISCNHVLQYYDADGQRRIIENLISVLQTGGLLYLEGLTEDETRNAGLQKYPQYPNLFTIGDG